MSAEVLRRAASLMRERAFAAPVGPWETEFSDVIRTDVPFGNPGYLVAECATIPEARHIASWHPGVAFAVANLLTLEAQALENFNSDFPDLGEPLSSGDFLAVARAYLGGSM